MLKKRIIKRKNKEKHSYSGAAITSFVLSILGAIWIFLLLFPSSYDFLKIILWYFDLILAILFGFAGLKKIKENRKLKGKRFAFFGIALSILILGLITIGYLATLIN
jgi:hypothetical protein